MITCNPQQKCDPPVTQNPDVQKARHCQAMPSEARDDIPNRLGELGKNKTVKSNATGRGRDGNRQTGSSDQCGNRKWMETDDLLPVVDYGDGCAWKHRHNYVSLLGPRKISNQGKQPRDSSNASVEK